MVGEEYRRMFGISFFRKHTYLIPTVAICGGACVMCAAYIGYMATTKPDLSYTPWKYGTTGPYQSVKPTEVRKFINLHKFTPNAEVEALKSEINSNYKA